MGSDAVGEGGVVGGGEAVSNASDVVGVDDGDE